MKSARAAPPRLPLTISAEEIEYGCRMICETLDEMVKDGDI